MRHWFPLLLISLPALAGPLIVVDPGHGGNQEGANSPTGMKEKQLSLDLAVKVKAALEQTLHARVRLTREKDVLLQLPDRVKFANDQKPDLFVSIHANSMPTKKLRLNTSGIETYFLNAAASGEDARKVAARENAEFPQAAKGGGGDTLSFILADLQRSERPISRWISWVRPVCLPFAASRAFRSWVARGSIPYSAVTQPEPLPIRWGGTRSSTLQVTRTLVWPNSTWQLPSAWRLTCGVRTIGRRSRGPRLNERIGLA